MQKRLNYKTEEVLVQGIKSIRLCGKSLSMNTVTLGLICAALGGCGGSTNPSKESEELTPRDWAALTAEEDENAPSQVEATDSPVVAISSEIRLLAAFLANPKGKVSPHDVMGLMFGGLEVEGTIDAKLFRSKIVGEPSSFDAEPRTAWAMLNAGYMAGNMKAQLEAGVKGDNREAGLCGMLKVYDVLKTGGEIGLVPEYEDLLATRTECLVVESK